MNSYLWSVMCVFLITFTHAQEESEREPIQVMDQREYFEFGIKAGVNISNVWDADEEDFHAETKAGIASGLFFSVPLGKYLGMQPEIVISQKGFQGTGTLLGAPYSLNRTTSYLDIPLLLQFKPAKFVTFVAGPSFSFLLQQKDVFTFETTNAAQEAQFHNDNIRKNLLGSIIGVDFFVSNFVISARAGWDFQSNLVDGTYLTPRYKNQWLQFTVGFKI